MVDVRIIVDHLKLDYTGVFDTKQLFRLINQWHMERGFQKRDFKTFEQSLADGKYIEHELAHWEKVSDYIRLMYKMRMLFSGLKRVEIMQDGKKDSMDQGKVLIYMDG